MIKIIPLKPQGKVLVPNQILCLIFPVSLIKEELTLGGLTVKSVFEEKAHTSYKLIQIALSFVKK